MSKVAQFLRPDQRCDIAQLRGIVADAVTEKTLEVRCENLIKFRSDRCLQEFRSLFAAGIEGYECALNRCICSR